MDDAATEAKLREAGFTEKEIASIKEWSQIDNVSCRETVRQIKRAFFGGFILMTAVTFFTLYQFVTVDIDEFWGFLIGYGCAIAGFYISVPVKLGTKIVFRLWGRI